MCFRTMGRCWKGSHTAREGRENSKTLKNHASVSSSYSERKEKLFLTSFFCVFFVGAKTLFLNCLPFIETHNFATDLFVLRITVKQTRLIVFIPLCIFFGIFCRKSKFFYYIFKIIINVALLKLLIHVQHVYDVTKHGYVTMTSVPLPVLDIIEKDLTIFIKFVKVLE